MSQSSLQLQQYIQKLVKEAQYWKNKYNQLKFDYDKVIQLIRNKINPLWSSKTYNNKNFKIEQTSFINQNLRKGQQICLDFEDDEENYNEEKSLQQNKKNEFQEHLNQQSYFSNNQSFKTKKADLINLISEKQVDLIQQDLTSPSRSPKNNCSQQQIDFFSLEQIKKIAHQQTQNINQNILKGFQLIDGYFILEKIPDFQKNKKIYQKWIKAGTTQMVQKQRQMLQIVYRYSFEMSQIQKIQDDQFDSRKNQIRFGTPFQDLMYAFEDFSSQKNQNLIKTSLKKRYIFCLIRPELVQIDEEWYQTQILYCIMSAFPFRGFFQDLHRVIQQQIKYSLLKSQKSIEEQVIMNKQNRVKAISEVMKRIYQTILTEYSHIDSFPIVIHLQTKVMTLVLQIQNTEALRKLQTESLYILARKYNLYQLSEILHYVLAQKQIIVVSKDRKSLNQIFEIIRLMILPFIWTFPIVYCYSSFFQGFLSSPMPLIVGVISQFPQKQKKQEIYINSLPQHQFVTIFVDKKQNQQKNLKIDEIYQKSNKIKSYQNSINYLFRYLNKKDKKSKTNVGERIQKYVNKLRKFIQSGVLDEEINEFYIQFMETQMVSFYKETCEGSAKKIKQNN